MITAEEPKVAQTARYSITQAAKILGIHRNTLRGYTKEGKIKFGVHKNNDRLFYSGYEIVKFWRSF